MTAKVNAAFVPFAMLPPMLLSLVADTALTESIPALKLVIRAKDFALLALANVDLLLLPITLLQHLLHLLLFLHLMPNHMKIKPIF